MNPLPNCEKFIVSTLRAYAALTALVGNRVYFGRPPQEPVSPNTVVYPCVVCSLQGGQGVSALDDEDNRILEIPVYVVKAVTQDEDYGGAHEVVHAFDEALKNARGPVTFNSRTVQIQGVRKVGPWIEYPEDGADGLRYNHVGATYRLFTTGV